MAVPEFSNTHFPTRYSGGPEGHDQQGARLDADQGPLGSIYHENRQNQRAIDQPGARRIFIFPVLEVVKVPGTGTYLSICMKVKCQGSELDPEPAVAGLKE